MINLYYYFITASTFTDGDSTTNTNTSMLSNMQYYYNIINSYASNEESYFINPIELLMLNKNNGANDTNTNSAAVVDDTKTNIDNDNDNDKVTDQRKCFNPENNIPWEFGTIHDNNNKDSSIIRSRTSDRTCNLNSNNINTDKSKLLNYLQRIITTLYNTKKIKCKRLVVYSVAFGSSKYLHSFKHERPLHVKKLHSLHGRCFFTFVLSERNMINAAVQNDNNINDDIKLFRSMDDLDVLVPIPSNVLPYKNMRRNTKIIKMLGQYIFYWTKYLIWQDAKFRMRSKYPDFKSMNYFHIINETISKYNVCTVYLGLPNDEGSTGIDINNMADYDSSIRDGGYMNHCNVVSSTNRKDVSDTQSSIMEQCMYYQDIMLNNYNNNHDITIDHNLDDNYLSSALIDSSFIIRDMSKDDCNIFNMRLSCTWLDEIHCFSDRDQISFPHVLSTMNVIEKDNVRAQQTKQQQHEPIKLKDPYLHHRVYVDTFNTTNNLVLIIKSSCHHYISKSIDDCFP